MQVATHFHRFLAYMYEKLNHRRLPYHGLLPANACI